MLQRIKDYFQRRWIEKNLKQASNDIFTSDAEFEALSHSYASQDDKLKRLLAYCLLNVASDRTPATFDARVLKVLEMYLIALQQVQQTSSINDVLEIQMLQAEEQLLNTKMERILDKELSRKNKYAYRAMKYEFESLGAPITPEQHEFILNTESKMNRLNSEINRLESQKLDE